jgi:hypothetical protein
MIVATVGAASLSLIVPVAGVPEKFSLGSAIVSAVVTETVPVVAPAGTLLFAKW